MENSSKNINEQDINILDCNLAPSKKDNLLEKLNKRNKERRNYNDIKTEQRSKESPQSEGVDYFAQSFTHRAHDIEQRIKSTSANSTEQSSGDAIHPDLVKTFVEIQQDLQELQRYLTTSTMFLTDFKIKSCQNILNELTSDCDEARQRLLPKKKFGFSSKKMAAIPQVKSKAIDKVDSTSEKMQAKRIFNWTLVNQKDAHICLTDVDVNGKDITMSHIENCLIELQGHAGSVQISNAQNSTILCGPISRSLFAEHCEHVTIVVACQQLRLHTSKVMRIYVHVTCRAIIEDCSQIEIASYNYDYPSIEEDFKLSGLDKSHNNYTDIADFNWLSPDVPSPNWTLLKDCAEPNWSEVRRNFIEKSSTVNKISL